jgi:murein DD-endopeptidase MepM/ murein hydrolase activator NlpD
LRLGTLRIGLYPLVALAFAGAIRFTPRLPDPERRPADIFIKQAGSPSARLHSDTLGRGETLTALLRRTGMPEVDVARVLKALRSVDQRRLPAGMVVTLRSEGTDTAPSDITLHLSSDHVLQLHRSGDTWTSSDEKVPWKTDTVVVTGTINSTLYAAMDASARNHLPAAARQQLTWSLADVYEYRVDMSRDLQRGDEFTVVAERSVGPSGAVRIGRVLAATFKLSGSVINAIRFANESSSSDYFDQDGKSMRAAFLRAPLEFRRISSVFGLRQHPVLGTWRRHAGTDYAASTGTPVRAIGDGTVVRAGWGRGYGNVLELRHKNGYVTRYGHLRGFARGVRVGSRVTIGQTVAYVGSTGLSTGPHLHFEVLVNGVQRDPRAALKRTGGDPVPAAERRAFERLRDRYIESLEAQAPGLTKLEEK